MVRGAREPPPRPITSAPMRRRGWTIRAIGLERRERSPFTTETKGVEASSPMMNRIVVPLLPAFSTSFGSVRPSSPGEASFS